MEAQNQNFEIPIGELGLDNSDTHGMTSLLRRETIERKPNALLSVEVECDFSKSLKLLFDKEQNLEERIFNEQFIL